MPWKEVTKMTQLREFVYQVQKKELNFSEICRRYTISRKTGYKWLKRYGEEGKNGLMDLSKKPLSSPNKTEQAIEDLILEERLKHPVWGQKRSMQYCRERG